MRVITPYIKLQEELLPGDIVHIVGQAEMSANATTILSRLEIEGLKDRSMYLYMYLGGDKFFYMHARSLRHFWLSRLWIAIIDAKRE